MARNDNWFSRGWDQVNMWDSGRTWSNKNPVTKPAPTPTPTPTYQPSTTKIDTSVYDKALADSNAAIKALQAQLAAQPKLPVFNTADAWARAQKGAENVVNPVYLDKLNQYLEAAKLKRAQTEEQVNFNKGNIQTELSQAIEDVMTGRQRTDQDTTSRLADIGATEDFYQEQTGTQFDRARTSLLGETASAGLTTSGIGQQQEANAISDRNKEEKEQTRQFNKERSSAEVLRTRTFEDLGKTESRAKTSAESRTKQEDMNLKNFIDTAALEEKDYRYQNELERQAEVASQVNNQYSIGVRDFINSLIGSGARPQDIALAQQVYGI